MLGRKKNGLGIILPVLVIIIIIIVGVMWIMPKMEKSAPVISSSLDDVNIGRNHEVTYTFTDEGTGLKKTRVIFEQNGNETVLFNKDYPKSAEVKRETVIVVLDPKIVNIQEGPASLKTLAIDNSWRSLGKGSRVENVENVVVDLRPPVITAVSAQHNIKQGGAGLVVYTLSKPVAKTGVWVGEDFYPGHAGYLADNPGLYLAFVALEKEAPTTSTVRVEAIDKAGNRAEIQVYNYLKAHKYVHDKINISDSFLRKVVPPFYPEMTADTPVSELLEKYLYVNGTVRLQNDVKLKEIALKTDPVMYWEGTFLRLPNAAPRAGFGDKRDYIYNGKVVDQQSHMGADLASLAMAPIPAANNGKVVFAEDLGIYGLCVVIDHGFGLQSLYGHMSSISVHEGDMVQKGDTIGRTGVTGLAVGDHLHFSMLVNGVFVDPIEWWDASWIKNNITDKLPPK